MSLAGLSKEEAFMHGWEVATQRAISRQELGLPLVRRSDDEGMLRPHQVAVGLTLDGRAAGHTVTGHVYFEQAKTAED